MIREVKFESQDRRIKQILAALNANGIKDIEEANAICEAHGLDPYKTCEETQPICFENAKWAYVVGCAIAIKKGCKNAAEAAEAIGIGLQAFCIPGSVADDRKVGIGHGNLAAMLLREETKCFAFLAGHESFAAAEGAIKIAAKADKVRKEPLRQAARDSRGELTDEEVQKIRENIESADFTPEADRERLFTCFLNGIDFSVYRSWDWTGQPVTEQEAARLRAYYEGRQRDYLENPDRYSSPALVKDDPDPPEYYGKDAWELIQEFEKIRNLD